MPDGVTSNVASHWKGCIGTPVTHAGLELRRDGLPLALWNRDVAAALPDGNIYGSWPAYIDIRPGERALGSGGPCRPCKPCAVPPTGSSAPH